MDKNSIAAQLYTVSDYCNTPDEIFDTLRKVKAIGYDAVQASGLGPVEPARLKEMADAVGLKICATHTPYERLLHDIDAVIAEHKLWDCEFAGLGIMPAKFRTIGREGYSQFIEEISDSAKRIFQSGLKFVYHNHKFEFEKFDGITGLEILIEKTDPESFGFELDTYWVQAGGGNPVDWIKKVKGRMGIVHFKDMAIIEDQQVFAEIGMGNLNWAAIVNACRETGVKWYAVEQDECRRNPFESLDISLKYLEKYSA